MQSIISEFVGKLSGDGVVGCEGDRGKSRYPGFFCSRTPHTIRNQASISFLFFFFLIKGKSRNERDVGAADLMLDSEGSPKKGFNRNKKK